jgi:hypothetical protein
MGLVNSSFFFLHNLNMSHENQEAPQKWLNHRLGRSFRPVGPIFHAPAQRQNQMLCHGPRGRILSHAQGPMAESYSMTRSPWQNHIPCPGSPIRISFFVAGPMTQSDSMPWAHGRIIFHALAQ